MERVLDAFEARVTPVWPRLRAQVAHTDLTVDNTLTDDDGFITGVIDFGDMAYTALITDLASVLDSVCGGRSGDELFRAARLVLDGYQRRVLLEEAELEALGVCWAARSAVTVAISSWRVAQGLEERAWAERYNAVSLQTLAAMETLGLGRGRAALGAEGARRPDPSLAARRAGAFGPRWTRCSTRPRSRWRGRGRLDHRHERPAAAGRVQQRPVRRARAPAGGRAAIARQSARINTHTRYLHPSAIELAERLTATCPPELDTVLFVNSGTEANDLAWRMATMVTGRRGGMCTSFAYHGISEAIAALSPESWFDEPAPEHVSTWDPFGDAFEAGPSLAAAILDGLVMSDGIADLDPARVREWVRRRRDAGGLWIADEVQAGHGRTGEALWCFERFGVVPDFVTLGKPMGNGHPVAAVITRSDIVAQLVGRTTLFSTFGGNPVSAAAALAVLDVIEDERVLERVQRTGAALGGALRGLGHPVRGVGLAWGVDLPDARAGARPDARARRAGRHHRPACADVEDPPAARVRRTARSDAHVRARVVPVAPDETRAVPGRQRRRAPVDRSRLGGAFRWLGSCSSSPACWKPSGPLALKESDGFSKLGPSARVRRRVRRQHGPAGDRAALVAGREPATRCGPGSAPSAPRSPGWCSSVTPRCSTAILPIALIAVGIVWLALAE